jgi:hypothetical protein
MKLNIDTKALNNFLIHLQKVKANEYPTIIKRTLNNIAYRTRKTLINPLFIQMHGFNVRNKQFLKNSMHYDSATGFNMDSMVARVGQLNIAKNTKTKTNLEKSELGTSVTSRTEHTIFGTKQARGGSFTKQIKQINRLINLKAQRASTLLKDYRFPTSDENNELSRIAGLVNDKRIKPTNVFAHTKKGVFGVYKVDEDGKTTKLYSLTDKINKVRKREFILDALPSDNEVNKEYQNIAKNILIDKKF